MPSLSAEDCLTLVNQAPILIWRSGLDLGCDFFNDVWLAFTGRPIEAELGNGWAEGVHPEDLDRCLAIYTTSFENKATFEMEYRLRRADGEYRWLLDRGAPSSDAGGVFRGYIGSCLDITDRKELDRLRSEAQRAKIEELEQLLPICAWCRKVRTGEGYWTSVEDYVNRGHLAKVTHGICEACEATAQVEAVTPA